MEDKQRTQYLKQVELADKMGSIMGHPEWATVRKLIEDEVTFHTNKSRSTDFRNDPNQYGNIVRAMDAADAVGAVLSKFDTIIRLGKEARETLARVDGTRT